MKEILEGGVTLRLGVESQLKEKREEAVEEEINRKVERLKIAWKERKEVRKLEQMVTKLEKLSIKDLDMNIHEIEEMIQNMMMFGLKESSKKVFIIETEELK